MTNCIFILSHQDDEIGIFESISSAVKRNENVYIFFMTSGFIDNKIECSKYTIRDKESIKVLKKIGVKVEKIFFFGRLNNIKTLSLHHNLKISYKKLKNFIKNLNGNIKLFTHAYEGGNPDHDSCNILILNILRNSKKLINAYQFPFYNANSRLLPYVVQKPLKINGPLIKIYSTFSNRLKYLTYLFYYKSQKKVWFGLYPFLIKNLLFKNYFLLQKINKNFIIKKPHAGKLLYEKFGYSKFYEIRSNFLKFLY